MTSKENMAQRPVFEVEQNQIKSQRDQKQYQASKDQIPRKEAGNLVRKAWSSFNLTVHENGEQSPVLDFTSSLQPIKMQYLLQYHIDTVNKHLIDTKYRIKTKDTEAAVIEVLSTDQQHDEILGEVVTRLDEMAKSVIKKTYPILKADARMTILQEFDRSFNGKGTDVGIYDDGKSSIVMVSLNESLEPAFDLLKQIIDDKQKRKRTIPIDTELNANLIHNLDYKNVLKSKADVKVSIDFKGQKMTFENSSTDDIEKYMQIMQKFLSSIIVTKLVCPETILKLLQSFQVREYIQDRLLHRDKKCFLHIAQNSSVVCYSLSPADGKYAIATIKTSIQTIRIEKTSTFSSEVSDVMGRYNNKYITNTIDEDIVELTATNDVAREILIVMAKLDGDKDEKLTHSKTGQCSQHHRTELSSISSSLSSESNTLVANNKTDTATDTNMKIKNDADKDDTRTIKPLDYKDDTFLRLPSIPASTSVHGTTKGNFTTYNGLQIKVYKGNILQLDVECIVSAANEHLAHGGGIADVIARAAGPEFDRESREYVSKYGPVPVGQCCATSAGNLHYNYVIHTVGPRWNDYNDKQQCLDDLCSAVEEALNLAEQLQLKSIAIPSISAGIFGVPKNQCAEQYARAVEDFSRNKVSLFSNLKEVHFIDKDDVMCRLIEQTFERCLNGQHSDVGPQNHPVNLQDFDKGKGDLSSSRSAGRFKQSHSSLSTNSHSRSTSMEEEEKFEFQISSYLKLLIYKGSITDIALDVIVCPEDKDFTGYGGIAKALLDKGGSKYKNYRESFRWITYKEVEAMNVETVLHPYKQVFYVWPPRWGIDSAKKPYQFEVDLKETVDNILKKAEKKDMQSVSIPFLGGGRNPRYPTPVKTCSECMVAAIHNFGKQQSNNSSLKEVHFILNDTEAFSGLKDECERRFGLSKDSTHETDKFGMRLDVDKNSHKFQNSGNLNKSVGSSTTAESTSQDTNDIGSKDSCYICIDTITDPKKLPCGHIFCTDCIDQHFNYKPSCPQCGKVFGKVTGDQPPGTMEVKKKHWVHLAGYEKHGTIEVCYSIPSGKQTAEHPKPGTWYEGIYRSGHLPDNKKGNLVAKLLRIAFDRRLIFTIGHSRTTGAEGVVTWNDIHHKTRIEGGPQRFGYPDDTYLDRVLDELAVKGVTEESLNDP